MITTQLTIWHWFGLAAALVILEVIVSSNFFLLCLGLSAAIVGIIINFWAIAWMYQLLLFATLAIASIIGWQYYNKCQDTAAAELANSALNRRSAQYIGRVFTLIEPIENGRGKIRVDDSFWLVAGPDLPIATKVKVIAVDGVILQVEQAT